MPFVRNTNKPAAEDLTMAAIRGLREKKGQVGIEVEVEGRDIPREVSGGFWNYVRDGSLRGTDNGEFVLKKPIEFREVDDAVKALWQQFKENGTRLDNSNRTSVHVHLNVMPFHMNRLASLLCLWYIFEEVLSLWCGEHRAGNLFCIRAKDGPNVITQAKRFIESKGRWQLSTEQLHYSALNLSAIQELGSVEIRTMRGVTEPEPLLQWVSILQRLYEASDRYQDPRSIVESFSMDGPMDFFINTFGDLSEVIRRGIEFTDEEIRASLFEGMRYGQDVVYSRDWTDFNPVKKVVDPFGREGKTSKIIRTPAPPINAAPAPRWAMPPELRAQVFADPIRLEIE